MQRTTAFAKYAKALSHPARVTIVKLLIQRQACICGDIVDELPLSQSTVSQHLKELKEAGLIEGRYRGSESMLLHRRKGMDYSKELTLMSFLQTISQFQAIAADIFRSSYRTNTIIIKTT
jgi:DNA-binding transcriptional ArsR family regulator